MSAKLSKAIEKMKTIRMSKKHMQAQRRSFAYGNAHLENEHVTRQMIEEADERLMREGTEED